MTILPLRLSRSGASGASRFPDPCCEASCPRTVCKLLQNAEGACRPCLHCLACPHRLAVDGDVTRDSDFLEKQGSQNIGQSLRVDDAQGFGQCRMARRRPAYKAEFHLLTPAGSDQEERPPSFRAALTRAIRRSGSGSTTACRLPLLAARVRNLPQNRFQLRFRRLLKSGSLLNQNVRARSISSVRSIDCPGNASPGLQ